MNVDPPRCIAADARQDAGYREALGPGRADVLITDPPYCLLTRRRRGGDVRDPKGRKIDRDPVLRFESVREYREFTAQWLPRAVAHVAPAAPLVIWTNFLGKEPILSLARELGYGVVRGEFVWAKRTKDSNGNEQLLRVYEVAVVIARAALAPVELDSPPVPWSVVTGYDDEGEGPQWGEHPHHKPFSALEPLVRSYSRPGQIVLDPFAGSGSIPAAALALGRRVACLELKPEWARKVTQRLLTVGPVVGS